MLQVMVSLRNYDVVEENKKQNIVTVSCSLRKNQILTIWHFHATTRNNDLNINNNMANKKMMKN